MSCYRRATYAFPKRVSVEDACESFTPESILGNVPDCLGNGWYLCEECAHHESTVTDVELEVVNA